MKSTDLSVIMPNYNHAHYLPRALDAILRQSTSPREILVVDDASTDDSVSVVERIARRHPIVRLICNDRNRGVSETTNRGVGLSAGRYFLSTAADDLILPGFIQKSMDLLTRHPEAGLSCAYCSTVDGATGAISGNPSGWCERPAYLAPREFADRIGFGCIPGHATIYKRSAFERAGGFLPDLRWHSDWFTNFVIAFRDGICHVPETLALLTVLPTSYSAQGTRNAAAQREVLDAILARLTSADYADVAPFFRETGVLTAFGPEVVRAAEARPDRWGVPVLGLISRFTPQQYEALSKDDDAEVRALAGFFLGPLWRMGEGRRERLEARLAEAKGSIAWMKTSKFWKVRDALVRLKRIVTGAREAG